MQKSEGSAERCSRFDQFRFSPLNCFFARSWQWCLLRHCLPSLRGFWQHGGWFSSQHCFNHYHGHEVLTDPARRTKNVSVSFSESFLHTSSHPDIFFGNVEAIQVVVHVEILLEWLFLLDPAFRLCPLRSDVRWKWLQMEQRHPQTLTCSNLGPVIMELFNDFPLYSAVASKTILNFFLSADFLYTPWWGRNHCLGWSNSVLSMICCAYPSSIYFCTAIR